ncbi:hypothetical protein AC579_7418 [Pseudocercospora musae]|uniref:Amino acid permease/ SLC12A domain-containing protein n=1 Tax=Pseudocercospora musae TaxID=113226 RepID=A0A139IQE1_9PEZI|nr:hypothetical protein AC579_7418 [Pseudocercospora musae]
MESDIEASKGDHIATAARPEPDVDQMKHADERKNVGTLERKLKSRHIQFLALSGAIGTGLFVGSGQVLSLAGPLSTFLAYSITGFNLFCVINSLGEMATYLPIPGAVPVYAARFVDPALGFVLGWNYWYQLAIGVPIETTVSAIIIGFWPNNVSTAVWITVLTIPMVIVNCVPVNFYGEAEFIFGAIKLTTIIGLILLMLIIDLGGAPNNDRIGFRYWINPGPMNDYLRPGALGRFLAFWKVFVQATFAYGGSEMCVIAAGETQDPRRNIPKAVRRVFWRILIFYVLAIFLVGMCVSSEDSRLLNAIDAGAPGAAASPFVIAIVNGGIPVLPHIINAVILSSAWSAGNAFFYSSTRVLYASALDGKAPKSLTFERFGVPYACVGATTLLSLLAYLNVSNGSAQVFFWFSNISAVSTLIVWCSINITYLRFYYGLRQNSISRTSLPWKAPFQPFLAYFGVCFCSLFLGYKLIKRTKVVKLSEMDLWSGKAEIDILEGHWPERVPCNWLERVWFWMA